MSINSSENTNRLSDNILTCSSLSQAFQGMNRDFTMKIIWCYSEMLCPCWDKLKRFIAFSVAAMLWKTLSCTSLLIICHSHTIMFSFPKGSGAAPHAQVKISLCYYLGAAVKNCSVAACSYLKIAWKKHDIFAIIMLHSETQVKLT